jgi:alkylation response protein AidB-like acyl-CoA dehydrogenase
LGELIAFAECAGSLARRAARLAAGTAHEKAQRRFHADAVAALARIFARDAALRVSTDGLRLIAGAGGIPEREADAFEAALGCQQIHRAQAGLLADMDFIADVIYERTPARSEDIA